MVLQQQVLDIRYACSKIVYFETIYNSLSVALDKACFIFAIVSVSRFYGSSAGLKL
jgi:hypothetical protein